MVASGEAKWKMVNSYQYLLMLSGKKGIEQKRQPVQAVNFSKSKK